MALCCVGAAQAQEQHKAGLVAGYPTEVGVLIHLSDRVAIRPAISLDFQVVDSTVTLGSGTLNTSYDLWDTQVGTSLLIYLREPRELRPYVAGRVMYLHRSLVTSTTTTTPDESESVTHGIRTSGVFGGQYQPTPRVAFFGEFGVEYGHQWSTLPASSPGETTSTSAGTRTAAGIVLYF